MKIDRIMQKVMRIIYATGAIFGAIGIYILDGCDAVIAAVIWGTFYIILYHESEKYPK